MGRRAWNGATNSHTALEADVAEHRLGWFKVHQTQRHEHAAQLEGAWQERRQISPVEVVHQEQRHQQGVGWCRQARQLVGGSKEGQPDGRQHKAPHLLGLFERQGVGGPGQRGRCSVVDECWGGNSWWPGWPGRCHLLCDMAPSIIAPVPTCRMVQHHSCKVQ